MAVPRGSPEMSDSNGLNSLMVLGWPVLNQWAYGQIV